MDANSELTVHVVTPDGSVYEHATQLAVVKTPLGELGIMPHHVPLLAALAIDEVRVKISEGKFDEIAVSGGFAEFSNNTLTVVANAAEPKEKIDVKRAQRAKSRAEDAIKQATAAHDVDSLKRAEISLSRAINRINISSH